MKNLSQWLSYDEAFVMLDALESYENCLNERSVKVRGIMSALQKDIEEWEDKPEISRLVLG